MCKYKANKFIFYINEFLIASHKIFLNNLKNNKSRVVNALRTKGKILSSEILL